MAPNVGQLVSTGVRTALAFGQRVPGAGHVLAPSLSDAVRGKAVMITGGSSGIGQAAAYKIGEAHGAVILVARTREKLEETAREVEARGGTAHVAPCDLSDPDDIDRMAHEVIDSIGVPDIVVNNAGRSIRRSVRKSYERFHDYQRTMQLNYFGAVKLILDVLPGMRERGSGHIINISTIGLQTNTPRYSAYVASKAALDAFSRSIASEIIDDGVHVTTIYMPLVRTPMIAPTKMYDRFPTLSPDEAAGLIMEAIRRRPKRIATTLGSLGQLTYAVAPGAQDILANQAIKLFPEGGEGKPTDDRRRLDQEAFARATRGVHW
ncbi:MAG TPA: SDR family NAD(P)-dependent oxidoreductase [Acidimicrobiales bacterium]|nr:SDR family NAD(P)-dependent oxidoreductase [Acidimicrobiales bacterium]